MFHLDRRLGFVSVNLYVVTVMLVWGFRGNLYRAKRIIRIDWHCGVHRCRIMYISGWRKLETALYVFRFLRPWRWSWNSEHLAYHYGYFHAAETSHPDYYVFRHRWLGEHLMV